MNKWAYFYLLSFNLPSLYNTDDGQTPFDWQMRNEQKLNTKYPGDEIFERNKTSSIGTGTPSIAAWANYDDARHHNAIFPLHSVDFFQFSHGETVSRIKTALLLPPRPWQERHRVYSPMLPVVFAADYLFEILLFVEGCFVGQFMDQVLFCVPPSKLPS